MVKPGHRVLPVAVGPVVDQIPVPRKVGLQFNALSEKQLADEFHEYGSGLELSTALTIPIQRLFTANSANIDLISRTLPPSEPDTFAVLALAVNVSCSRCHNQCRNAQSGLAAVVGKL